MELVRVARRVSRLALVPLALSAVILPAQERAKADTNPSNLFILKDAALGVGFIGLTFALMPVDRSMAQRLQHQGSFTGPTVDRWATGFDYLAFPGVFVAGVGSYALGRLKGEHELADFGWHTTEATLVGLSVTQILKGVAGRSRPYVSADTNPRDFKWGAGFANDPRQSFPSGHATIAFAAASAATGEVQRHWPRYTWVAGTLSYGSATMVGLARMVHNQHWASDVVLGAGIGTFAGLKTVRYNHQHPNNVLNRVLLHTSITPDGRGGALLMWSAPAR